MDQKMRQRLTQMTMGLMWLGAGVTFFYWICMIITANPAPTIQIEPLTLSSHVALMPSNDSPHVTVIAWRTVLFEFHHSNHTHPYSAPSDPL